MSEWPSFCFVNVIITCHSWGEWKGYLWKVVQCTIDCLTETIPIQRQLLWLIWVHVQRLISHLTYINKSRCRIKLPWVYSPIVEILLMPAHDYRIFAGSSCGKAVAANKLLQFRSNSLNTGVNWQRWPQSEQVSIDGHSCTSEAALRL